MVRVSMVAVVLALVALTLPNAAQGASWHSVPAPWVNPVPDPNTDQFPGPPESITRVPGTSTVWAAGDFGEGVELPFERNTGSGWRTFDTPDNGYDGIFWGITATTSG